MTENLHYRFARPDDLGAVGSLIPHSFPSPVRSPEYWQAQLQDLIARDGLEALLVAQDRRGLAASLFIHRFHQWIAGASLPMAGIGTVTVSPTHRQRRIAGELMAHALRAARERGDLVSALYPFRVSFYQNLGYGQAGEALQFQIPPQVIPSFEERHAVELLSSESARSEALTFFTEWARSQTGQLDRSASLWSRILSKDGIGLVGYREGGKLEGYALVSYHNESPGNRYLSVDELVWSTPAARRGLYGWLASLADQWKQVVVNTLPSHRFADWVKEPRLPPGTARGWGLYGAGAVLLLGPMLRIIDLRNAWEQRAVAAGSPFSVAIDVHDEQLEENRGTWRLGFDLNRVTVEKRSDADFAVRTNISTLSRLFVGAISASQAKEAELLETDRPERLAQLDEALRLPEPWMFDRF